MQFYRTGADEAEPGRTAVDLETVIDYLDASRVKSYRMARAALEFAKMAIGQVIPPDAGNAPPGVEPLITSEMKEAIKNLDKHAQKIASDTSTSEYPDWNDLRHWVVVSFEEYAKARRGGAPIFWMTVKQTVDKIQAEARGLFTRVKEETEKGMNVLQTVFVLGGLFAVGMVVKNWFSGTPAPPPNVSVGLLPAPHVSVSQPHVHT